MKKKAEACNSFYLKIFLKHPHWDAFLLAKATTGMLFNPWLQPGANDATRYENLWPFKFLGMQELIAHGFSHGIYAG